MSLSWNPFSTQKAGPTGVTDSRNSQFATQPKQGADGFRNPQFNTQPQQGGYDTRGSQFSTQPANNTQGLRNQKQNQNQNQQDAYRAQAGPGDHYEGYLKHPLYGDKEHRLLVTRVPAPTAQAQSSGRLGTQSAGQQSKEPQLVAWLEDMNVEKAFGKDGLKQMVEQVDRSGQLKGNVTIQDPQGRQSQEGTFLLKKSLANTPNAPDPLGLAVMRFGSSKRDNLEKDKGWTTWASQNGVATPAAKSKPLKHEVLDWYDEKNNFFDMIQKCQDERLDVCASYSGKTRMELRDVQPRFDESVASWMYGVSGGKVGEEFQQDAHKKEIEVVDLFEDREFGSPESHNTKSWWMPGDPNLDEAEQPAKWERLWDQELGTPYRLGATPQSPMPGKIYQGSIEDFYFVQACCAISMKSKLVQDLFINCDFSVPTNGLHMLRFYKHGQWTQVAIDGFLPYDKEENPMCCRHEDFPGVSWPSLAEKAYAKLHGSWMALGDKGGDVENVLVDLTGGCAGRFNSCDVAADRMWKYLSLMKNTTIWACSINNAECSKRTIPIAKHWASAIFDVCMYQGTPLVGVFTSAPFSSVRHFPLVDLGDQYDFHLGYMWLRVDDFAQLFGDIIECRLVNSDLYQYGSPNIAQQQLREPIPRPPGRPDPNTAVKTYGHEGGPWYETLWGFRGDADMSSSPSFLIHVEGDTELIMDIGQECSRYQAGQNAKEVRSDSEHGMYQVTYNEYLMAMKQKWPDYSRGQLADFWDTLPIEKNANQEAGGTGFVVREPEAPLLLRFYQCSADMQVRVGTGTGYRDMPKAESGDGEVHLVHMSTWAHTRDAMCCVKVGRAGVYMAQVSMPSQYSCHRLVFRTYSDKPVQVANFEWPRNLIVTNAGAPLGAIPYSLTGLPRIDSASDRLPRMFDDDHGAGKKNTAPAWARKLFKERAPESIQEVGGPKVLGQFGGTDAVATQAAKETQGGLSGLFGKK